MMPLLKHLKMIILIEDTCDEVDDAYKDDRGSWWELDSDDDATNRQSGKLSGLSVNR